LLRDGGLLDRLRETVEDFDELGAGRAEGRREQQVVAADSMDSAAFAAEQQAAPYLSVAPAYRW
jgi:hypothetical protein